MTSKSVAATRLRPMQRLASAIKSLRPAVSIAIVLTVVLGGAGIAGAATGHVFILGRSNTETTTAKLSDSRGIPMSLSAPRNKAPLAVNRRVMVKNLNSQYLGGLSAASLKPSGGVGFGASADMKVSGFTNVAATGSLAAGTYYVTATAYIDLDFTGATGATCVVALNGNFQHPLQSSSADLVSSGIWVQTAQTLAVSVPAKGVLQEWCTPTGGTVIAAPIADSPGITALRILSSGA